MKMRSILWLMAVFFISYSTLSVVVTTLSGTVEDYRNRDSSISLTKQRERSFYKHHLEAMQELVEDSELIDWNHVRDDFDLHQLAATNNTTLHYIETRNLCGLAQAFERWQDSVMYTPTPHVLWWRSPTDSNDPTLVWQEAGCSIAYLLEYLQHVDTKAVVVTHNYTGVRILGHNKLFPIPTGLWQDKSDLQRTQLFEAIMEELPLAKHHNRTLTVLIVGDRYDTRRTMEIKDRLIRNFGASAVKAVYPPQDDNHALLYENMLKARFVVGLGEDQEDWITEALALGSIPILEQGQDNTHHRRHSTTTTKIPVILLEKLPVVHLGDFYDNITPELLELEYAAVLHKVGTFEYERLSQLYWMDRAIEKLNIMEEHASKTSQRKDDTKSTSGKRIFLLPHNRRQFP